MLLQTMFSRWDAVIGQPGLWQVSSFFLGLRSWDAPLEFCRLAEGQLREQQHEPPNNLSDENAWLTAITWSSDAAHSQRILAIVA